MAYAKYLRNRSSECVNLAVETAGQDGTDALIDLAQDYSRWAASVETAGTHEPGLDQEDSPAVAAGTEADRKPLRLRRLFDWAARR